MSKRGIDISGYQTVTNWPMVATQVDFAVLKIIRQDGNMDKGYLSHLSGCRSTKIPVIGVYNYSYATTVNKAIKDANLVVQYLKASGLSTAVWLDIEDECMKGLGGKLINIIQAYKDVIMNAGYPFGVYTGLYFYNTYMKPYASQLWDVPMWIARYPSTSPKPISSAVPSEYQPQIMNMIAWQYSSKGQVTGINGNVDLDEYYAPITEMTTTTLPTAPTYEYYPKCKATYLSIVKALASVGEKNTTIENRKKIATLNGIANYKGTAAQNIKMLTLLKQGKLRKG